MVSFDFLAEVDLVSFLGGLWLSAALLVPSVLLLTSVSLSDEGAFVLGVART